MHKEILTREQVELLPLLKKFSDKFSLVGGTAVALCIGHRRSIDFDLFSLKSFRNSSIQKIILKSNDIKNIYMNKPGEYTLSVNDVKMTFFHYPFKISFTEKLNSIIKMPDLLTLAAMKAFALGQRAKWKDYVDLYFIMRHYHSLKEISQRAKQIYSGAFNEKLLRGQLSYFKDVNCSEKIEYMKGWEVSDATIKKALREFSVV